MSQIKDLVIIGSGPAGLSAAIYAKRAMLDVVVIEKEMFSGGQIVNTERIDNYLGMYGENGYDLAVKFREHAENLGVIFLEAEVADIVDHGDEQELRLDNGEVIETKAILIATGAKHRLLGVDGELEFAGAGVSYCATCDGAFFKNKTVAVVGGGDVALEDAIYLSKLCEKVYLIHRRDTLRGNKLLQKTLFETENISFLPNCEIKEICGDTRVERVVLVHNQTGEESELPVSGVFIAVGMAPQNSLVKNLVELDEAGYVVAGEDCRTSNRHIYAAGDIRTKSLRQVATAVADGAVAITSLEQDCII